MKSQWTSAPRHPVAADDDPVRREGEHMSLISTSCSIPLLWVDKGKGRAEDAVVLTVLAESVRGVLTDPGTN